MADSVTDLKNASTAISNGIGSLHREHYGRGADRIRTLIHKDVVLTTLEDCFTQVEHKMVAEGAFPQVRETRTMFQDWMRAALRCDRRTSHGPESSCVLLAGHPRPRHRRRVVPAASARGLLRMDGQAEKKVDSPVSRELHFASTAR